MIHPWRKSSFPCPSCGFFTEVQNGISDEAVSEEEERCPNPKCGLYEAEISYGQYRERIGYAVFEWGWDDEDNFDEQRKAARAEMARVFAHPDFAAIREHAPLLAAAGWLEDNDFPIQSAAVMEKLRMMEEVEKRA